MKTVLLVFGTRPEAIKMAPLIHELKKQPSHFRTIVCVTGQHREMLDQVLELFQIIPDYDLNIMRADQDLYDITSRVLLGMREVLNEVRPDVVVVHGDTTTSMVTALAAFYQQIPVAHVEAGLRTGNIYSPWPEEINRLITGRIAAIHFAPTLLSKQNLIKENVPESSIVVTGNTVIDALKWVVDRIGGNNEVLLQLRKDIRDIGYDVERLEKGRRLVLVTGHRRENYGEGFRHIFCAIKSLSEKYEDVDFVYPLHLNPNVRKPAFEIMGGNSSNVFFIEPLQYLQFVFLMGKSCFLLTDSGGIQEEASALKKPVLVMRDTTERSEAVEAGAVILVGTDDKRIEQYVSKLLDDDVLYEKMSGAVNPYGDGKACERIVDFLIDRI